MVKRTEQSVKVFLFFLALIFLISCANQLPPGGGEVDSIPPEIISSYPENGTTNFAPLVDKDGIERVENPDIGAYEYIENLSNPDFTKDNFVVYPNPAKDIITIELPKQNNASFEGTIFNTMGQSVKTFNAMNNKINLNIEDLSSGIYFISLSRDMTNAFKLIKI